ncbi:hypothetical protein ABT160_42390 [Streptomyces sp. NPDC001941]|uniref:hypothetical protein n=1 Tax=Streptomyces sp. NPDC001941 TaxID=3154659 RepID=UPI00333163CB
MAAERGTENGSSYAWCFSHGRLHVFQAGQDPWCTAEWVTVQGATREAALAAKAEHFGDAQFFDELPAGQHHALINARGAASR